MTFAKEHIKGIKHFVAHFIEKITLIPCDKPLGCINNLQVTLPFHDVG
jgi:hypothetical protein